MKHIWEVSLLYFLICTGFLLVVFSKFQAEHFSFPLQSQSASRVSNLELTAKFRASLLPLPSLLIGSSSTYSFLANNCPWEFHQCSFEICQVARWRYPRYRGSNAADEPASLCWRGSSTPRWASKNARINVPCGNQGQTRWQNQK